MNLLYGLIAALTPAPCPAAPPAVREYWVDFGESIIEFSIKFTFNRVKGRFTAGQGTILYDTNAPANSSITFVLQAKSIESGSAHRDEHLRSSDFFDVEKFPNIIFQSRRLLQTRESWMAEGDLTMHGVTKRVTLPFRFTQTPVRSALSNWMMMDVAGSIRLARADFGILGGSEHNSWFTKARSATMGDSADITFEVQAYSPDAASQRSARIETELAKLTKSGVKTYVDSLREMQRTKPQQFAPYMVGLDLVARALIADCRLADAAALTKSITELFPDAHSPHLTNAFVLAVNGDASAATAEFAKGKELFRPPVKDPNQKLELVDNTWWYSDQLVRSALEWGYKGPALQLARVLSEIYPTAHAFTTYGMALAANADAKGAASAFERAVQLDAGESRALEWRRH